MFGRGGNELRVLATTLVILMGCSEPKPTAVGPAGAGAVPPAGTAPAAGAAPAAPAAGGTANASSPASPGSSTPSGAAGQTAGATSPQTTPAEAPAYRPLVTIPERDSPLVYGPHGSSMVAIGGEVFDLETKQSVGTVPAKLNAALEDLALSPDGKWLAREVSPDHKFGVDLYDTATGEVARSIKLSDRTFERIEYLQFTQHGYLVVAAPGEDGGRLLIYDVAKPDPIRELQTKERLSAPKMAVSRDGKLLAAVQDGRLEIHDVAAGKRVKIFDPPSHKESFNPMIFLHGLAFSPDGSQLASLFTLEGFRFIVWDLEGNIVLDQPLGLQIGGAYNDGPGIEWSPDGAGWLLHGAHYFDRRLKVIAWILKSPVQHNYHHRWLNDKEVVGTIGDFQNRKLVAAAFPRQAIDRAAGALESSADALLKPGDGISLDVRVGATRFAAAQQVRDALYEKLAKRFTENGLVVGENQPVTLTLEYSEGQGKQLNVVQGPLLGGRPTGQQVQETVVNLSARMTRTGHDEPIWEAQFERGNPHMVHSDTIDDQKVREATFRGIEYTLSSVAIPYFVPADGNMPQLPITTDLSKS